MCVCEYACVLSISFVVLSPYIVWVSCLTPFYIHDILVDFCKVFSISNFLVPARCYCIRGNEREQLVADSYSFQKTQLTDSVLRLDSVLCNSDKAQIYADCCIPVQYNCFGVQYLNSCYFPCDSFM